MRGRCERHQLALGPSGCVLCRRGATAAPGTTGGVSAEPPSPADAVTPSSADVAASAPPRRSGVQVPGIALLLPLLAAAFYFFAFVGGRPVSPPGSTPAAAESDRAAATPAARDGAPSRTPSTFPTLVIEEPDAPARLPRDGAPPERAAPAGTPARAGVANSRAAAQAQREAEAAALAEMREHVDVVVYSTSWCPACRSLRSYLDRRGIRATEYDIERNRSAKARQRELNPRGGVPTVEIDGQVLVGFSPRSLEAALDRAARARLQRL